MQKNISSPKTKQMKKEKKKQQKIKQVGALPMSGIPLLKVAVNVDEFIQLIKAISLHIMEEGLLFNLDQLRQDQQK